MIWKRRALVRSSETNRPRALALLLSGTVALLFIPGLTVGCGASETKKVATAPIEATRALTAGDPLVKILPAGADAILEIDLARLRENPAVGEATAELIDQGTGASLLTVSDVIVIASYEIGTEETERVILCRGQRVAEIESAVVVSSISASVEPASPESNTLTEAGSRGHPIAVIASPSMRRRIEAIASSGVTEGSASELLRLRALAMPEEAEGAALRLSANLGFDARLALAKAMDIDNVPVWVSVWGDVADDLAIVTLVGGKADVASGSLAKGLASVRDRLAAVGEIRLLGLARLIRSAVIENKRDAARMVLLVGPKRLARVGSRVVSRLRLARNAKEAVTPGSDAPGSDAGGKAADADGSNPSSKESP